MSATPTWCASSAVSYLLAAKYVHAHVLAVAPCLRCRMLFLKVCAHCFKQTAVFGGALVCALFVAVGHARV